MPAARTAGTVSVIWKTPALLTYGWADRGVNDRPGQATAILVEEDVERRSRARSIEIYALRVHFGDIPSLASGNDEIVSGKVVKGVDDRLEILRASADRLQGCLTDRTRVTCGNFGSWRHAEDRDAEARYVLWEAATARFEKCSATAGRKLLHQYAATPAACTCSRCIILAAGLITVRLVAFRCASANGIAQTARRSSR